MVCTSSLRLQTSDRRSLFVSFREVQLRFSSSSFASMSTLLLIQSLLFNSREPTFSSSSDCVDAISSFVSMYLSFNSCTPFICCRRWICSSSLSFFNFFSSSSSPCNTTKSLSLSSLSSIRISNFFLILSNSVPAASTLAVRYELRSWASLHVSSAFSLSVTAILKSLCRVIASCLMRSPSTTKEFNDLRKSSHSFLNRLHSISTSVFPSDSITFSALVDSKRSIRLDPSFFEVSYVLFINLSSDS
mmetsp:Transcript_15590/g.18501  ORF Transcript_15590/g.18501 Transcript_15590/m.18501 type:complete len:246 (-) Transcript_15590:33-770(-)